MSFLKKLFGKKESAIRSKSETGTDVHAQHEVEASTITESLPNRVDEAKKKYDISQIKKMSTQVKNKDGFLASVDYVKSFVQSTEIEFRELVSLLKKIIPYMLKEKTISDEDTLNYIKAEIAKHGEKDDVSNFTAISDLYGRVDVSAAIEYLEEELGEFKTDKTKDLSHFDPLIQLFDLYLRDKRSEEARQNLGRATMLITNFSDKFDFLSKHKTVVNRRAQLALNSTSKPKYADFIYFEVVEFIFEIAGDIACFPLLSGFFYRKEICASEGWGFNNNPELDKAIDNLQLSVHRASLMSDIYDFTFNDLPLKMGIPKELLRKDLPSYGKSDSDSFEEYRSDWRHVMDVKMELDVKPFDISIAYDSAKEIIGRYYTGQ